VSCGLSSETTTSNAATASGFTLERGGNSVVSRLTTLLPPTLQGKTRGC